MKLIFCPQCNDIRKLNTGRTYCNCGKSFGWYQEDGNHASIGGLAIPIGIKNSSFERAVRTYNSDSARVDNTITPFDAFVFEKRAITVHRVTCYDCMED